MTEAGNPENIQNNIKNQSENVQVIEKPIEKKVEDVSPHIKSEENQANWKKFREDREKDRKARQDAEEMAAKKHAEAEALKSAMEAILNRPAPQQNQNSYTEEEESQDKIIERKIKEAIERDRIQQREEQQKIEAQTFPKRIVQEHKDFNNVCTAENLDYLEFHFPEVAAGYKYMPDGFDKWNFLYKAIKKFVPLGKKEDEERINKNIQKPKAHLPTMTDNQPQTSGWKITEERRKENWERMKKDRKSMG